MAQALFITSTTEGHVSHIFRKLGITRRADVAGALLAQDGTAAG